MAQVDNIAKLHEILVVGWEMFLSASQNVLSKTHVFFQVQENQGESSGDAILAAQLSGVILDFKLIFEDGNGLVDFLAFDEEVLSLKYGEAVEEVRKERAIDLILGTCSHIDDGFRHLA